MAFAPDAGGGDEEQAGHPDAAEVVAGEQGSVCERDFVVEG